MLCRPVDHNVSYILSGQNLGATLLAKCVKHEGRSFMPIDVLNFMINIDSMRNKNLMIMSHNMKI